MNRRTCLHRAPALAFIAALSLTAFPSAAQAPAGALDVTLDGRGWAAFPTPPTVNSIDVRSAAMQSDGKVVITGAGIGSSPYGIVMRRNPNATPDLSFNGTGTASLPESGPFSGNALRSDGRIVTGGNPKSGTTHLIASFLPDGQPDPSFGPGGTGYTTPALGSITSRVALQPDGKVVACSNFNNAILRFLTSGALDTTFGTGGVAAVPGSAGVAGFYDMALLPDGKILLCRYDQSSSSSAAVTRLLPDGAPDLAFGNDGTVSLAAWYPTVLPLLIRCVKPLPDGKILAACVSGPTGDTIVAERGFVLVRLLASGTPDPGFGDPATPGLGRISFGDQVKALAVSSLLILRDGRPLLAGFAATEETQADVALARFTVQGREDAAFGNGGRVTMDFNLNDVVADAVLVPSVAPAAEKVLVIGNQYPRGGGYGHLFLARFIAQPNAFLHAEYPPGIRLPVDVPAVVDLGPVTVTARIVEVVLENAGTVTLTNIQGSLTKQSHPGEYQVTLPPAAASLAPGAKVSASISFTPSAPGALRTATLTFTSATQGVPPRAIDLSGSKATPQQTWRIIWFGSPDNSGPGADLNDFDGDGLPNFMEYATMGNPHQPSPAPLHPGPDPAGPGTFTYSRPAAALTDFSYIPESAPTPAGPWSSANLTSTILADDAVSQTVQITPAAPGPLPQRLFLRLRVTKLIGP